MHTAANSTEVIYMYYLTRLSDELYVSMSSIIDAGLRSLLENKAKAVKIMETKWFDGHVYFTPREEHSFLTLKELKEFIFDKYKDWFVEGKIKTVIEWDDMKAKLEKMYELGSVKGIDAEYIIEIPGEEKEIRMSFDELAYFLPLIPGWEPYKGMNPETGLICYHEHDAEISDWRNMYDSRNGEDFDTEEEFYEYLESLNIEDFNKDQETDEDFIKGWLHYDEYTTFVFVDAIMELVYWFPEYFGFPKGTQCTLVHHEPKTLKDLETRMSKYPGYLTLNYWRGSENQVRLGVVPIVENSIEGLHKAYANMLKLYFKDDIETPNKLADIFIQYYERFLDRWGWDKDNDEFDFIRNLAPDDYGDLGHGASKNFMVHFGTCLKEYDNLGIPHIFIDLFKQKSHLMNDTFEGKLYRGEICCEVGNIEVHRSADEDRDRKYSYISSWYNNHFDDDAWINILTDHPDWTR